MKRLLMIPALLLALTVSACGPGTKVGDLISLATSTVTNPVTAVNVYQVKNGYAAALELAVAYRSYCWSKSYAAILKDPVMKPLCQSRRSAVRSIQKAQLQAHDAIDQAQEFVRLNPTLDASAVIALAVKAVGSFRSAVPLTN